MLQIASERMTISPGLELLLQLLADLLHLPASDEALRCYTNGTGPSLKAPPASVRNRIGGAKKPDSKSGPLSVSISGSLQVNGRSRFHAMRQNWVRETSPLLGSFSFSGKHDWLQ